jgi:hypothetical protein
MSTARTQTRLSKTITATPPYGTWAVEVKANDFCGTASTSSATFVVNPFSYNVGLSRSGVPPSATASMQVDGVNQDTISGAQSSNLSFPFETSHTISVSENLAGESTGVRYHCSQNTWSFSSTGNHTFNFQTQYQFMVHTDPEGILAATGSGWFDADTTVRTNQTPQTVVGQTPGVQYVFKYWEIDGAPQTAGPISLTMNMPHTAIAKYVTQYRLLVDSQNNLGKPQGSNYYDTGSVANFSVSTPIGILIQQRFVQWTGDYTGTSPQGSILMDKPHEVHAVWTRSYTQLYTLVGAILVVILTTFILRRQHSRSRIDHEATTKSESETREDVPVQDGAEIRYSYLLTKCVLQSIPSVR